MADLILDLSGQTGLAENFFGDADMITPRPELRIGKTTSDIVAGVYNPYLRMGYMAPATTATTNITTSVTPTNGLGSVEFDFPTETTYWADRVNVIYQGNPLNDTSLTALVTLVDSNFPKLQYDELHDLQVYTLNNATCLFYVGKGPIFDSNPVDYSIANNATSVRWVSDTLSILPFSTVKPAITASVRQFTAATATTSTVALTIPSGTNQVLTVFAAWSSAGAAPTSMTWNGSATGVTIIDTDLGGPGMRTFKLSAPTATTANIVVTWPATEVNRLVYAIVTNNTDQTTSMYPQPKDTTSIPVIARVLARANLQLTVYAAMSAAVMDSSANTFESTLFSSTNSYGSDIMVTLGNSGWYGLQVGLFLLPYVGVTPQYKGWFSNVATGKVQQSLTSKNAFMRVADNRFAYVFADNHVHMIDGTTTGGVYGTIVKDVLLFPPTITLSDAVDYRGRLYIAGNKNAIDQSTTSANTFRGGCFIYSWDKAISTRSNYDIYELPGIKEIKKIYASPDGELRVLAIADNGLVELRQYGYNNSRGIVFETFKVLGQGANPQFPDGLTIAGDKVLWQGNDGKLYCEKKKMVTQLFEIKAPGTSTATLASNISTGAVFYGSNSETAGTGFRNNKQAITYSYVDGGTHYLKKVYPFDLTTGNDGAQAQHTGNVYTAVQLIPVTSVVRNVRVYNAPTSTSGATAVATVKLFFNQGTSSTAPNGMTKTITMNEAKRGYVDFKINQPYLSSIQLKIEWATGINLGVDTYLPSAAVISYDPTKTQSPDNG